ncbi:MAG TPA: bestrophin family ion channel [Mycobacterium sp.]
MIRSVGAAGPIKVLVAWQLSWDLLAVLIIAAVMVPIPDAVQSDNVVAVLSVLGIAASIFIGFRNSNAYARWWEARTLWGGIIINCRTLTCSSARWPGSSGSWCSTDSMPPAITSPAS